MSSSIHPTPDPAVVAYIMTFYPRVATTFLQQEVLGVASSRLQVLPISINGPEPDAVRSETDRREQERTFYIKSQPRGRVVRLVVEALRRHPGPFLAALAGAARSGGTDVKQVLWRAFQCIEGLIVWDHCRAHGARHLHAQFGSVPATVAMLAADLGNRFEPEGPTWTWSYTVHGFHDFVNEREIGLRTKTASAAFVVGISDFTRSQLLRLARAQDRSKIHVVRCGIDLDLHAMRPPRDQGPRPVIMSVGRLFPEKGFFVLVEAVALLARRGVDAELHLIGDGESRAEIEASAHDLGIADRLVLLGEQPPSQVVQELRGADVFCLPSFAEGLPVAIMEAMAIGVPVVTTGISGIPELVVDRETGMLVPPGRADLLADALEQILGDAALRSKIVAAGRARVVEQHDASRNLAQMRSLLLAAASDGGTQA